ncbi:hypothetical protein [Cognatilysobacter bugurensis]|uniref:Uncharacterized protein n=1 Tax=Cognatilysobacter bugurensis TaxID=543356 RepID=A0A918T3M5_9GAMM|nr:hypothetical protein [Lysobacter bugurensis]GHA89220.1 hypothetical protein GCM10007067_28920 [Lysobacter bugurensis]
MFAYARLFLSSRFGSRRPDPRHVLSALRTLLEPRKPRHRALRVLLGVVGVLLLAVLAVVGIALGALMLMCGLGYRMLRGSPRRERVTATRVVDGEYRVVARPVLPSH